MTSNNMIRTLSGTLKLARVSSQQLVGPTEHRIRSDDALQYINRQQVGY
jgi:hypothetical protein